MPDLANLFTAPWGGAARVQNAFVAPWGGAARVQALGNPWTPPASPPGGTEVTPGDLTAPLALAPATEYRQTHTMAVTDLRTGAPLNVDAVRIGLEDGGALWTLSASARDPGLFPTLTTGEQPAGVEVTVDGLVWRFLIETVQRPRTHGQRITSFGGRSLAAVADKPYQTELLYSADQPTTAAQLASSALLAAGVELEWKLADWLIPAGAVSLTGTPMDVLRTVAAAVGATVAAHPSEPRVTVESRYPQMPNEWAYVQPEVQIHSRAVREDTFDRADAPTYTGVFVAGQQAGALAYVRLEGTSGGEQAPMVTDPLLTDEAALRERGRVVLGAAGKQARVTRSLPVRTGAGEPGVLQRGALVRWVDEADAGGVEIWHGMVRAVSLEAALPVVRQTVTVERHTAWTPDPEVSTPLVFEGAIGDQSTTVGEPYLLDLTPFRSGGLAPYAWSLRSGVLPPGIALVGESLVGPASAAAPSAAVSLRVTDSVSQMQDSPPFLLGATEPGGAIYLLPYIPNDPILRSTDGGASWTSVGSLAGSLLRLLKTPTGFLMLGGLAKNSAFGNANYPPHAEYVYTSPDASTWTRVNDASVDGTFSSTQRPGYPSAAINGSGRVVISNRNSLRPPTTYYSDDGGATWAVSDALRYFNMLWSGRLGLFVGTSFNLVRTSPSGASGSWTTRSFGVSGQYGSYACDDGAYLVVSGTSGSGPSNVARSADGLTWTQFAGALPGPCYGLAAMPGRVVAQQATSPWLLYSDDGGATWVGGSGLGSVTAMDGSSEPVWTGNEFLVFCNTGAGWRIYASTDGATWGDRGSRPTGTADATWPASGPRGYMMLQAPDAAL